MYRILTILMMITAVAHAGEHSDGAKAAQNPLADLMKLEVENRFDPGYGHKDQLLFMQSYRPSIVSEVSKDWNMINRLDVPFLYQPGRTVGEKDSFGLGDTTYESFYSPSKVRNVQWGVGPVFQIPTATDNQLGSKKWSAGLGGTGNVVRGPVVAGLRANHLWSFAGDKDRPDTNFTTIEYWLYANLGRGWWIGTSPINTANWEAASGNEWTIPIGGGIGKVIIPDRIPINLKLEAYSYAEAPADAADWSLMLSFEFLYSDTSLFKNRN